jgi:hypothetical protein
MFPSSHNLSDDGRRLPEPSCPQASQRKSTRLGDAPESAQSTRYRAFESPVNLVRGTFEAAGDMSSPEQWLPFHKAVWYMRTTALIRDLP